MSGYFKQYIKRTINAVGIEAHCFNPNRSPWAQLMADFVPMKLISTFDIDANGGQFDRKLRVGGYPGPVSKCT